MSEAKKQDLHDKFRATARAILAVEQIRGEKKKMQRKKLGGRKSTKNLKKKEDFFYFIQVKCGGRFTLLLDSISQ
jgi:hypothetical protein